MGSSLTILDICLLALFIPAVISGIMKGFVYQAASLIALLLGIWAAYNFSGMISPILKSWFGSDSTMINILAFVIIFVVVLILVTLVGKLASKLLEIVLLGWLDKILGALFAILKTAFIISIIIYILNSLDTHLEFLPKWTISQSKVYLFLQEIAPKTFPYFQDLPEINDIISTPDKTLHI